jgi:hypothetical protein
MSGLWNTVGIQPNHTIVMPGETIPEKPQTRCGKLPLAS